MIISICSKGNPGMLVFVEDFSGSELILPLDLPPETALAFVGRDQPDLILLSPLTGELKLTRSEDYLRIQGNFATQAQVECYRCLASFTALVSAEVNELLKLGGCPPAEDEEAEGYLEIIEGQVDLGNLLNEFFWLAWPQRHLCQPHCAGLCLRCGTDLNGGPCTCS